MSDLPKLAPEAFAWEVEERMRTFLRPAMGNPQRALRLAVLALMEQESEGSDPAQQNGSQ